VSKKKVLVNAQRESIQKQKPHSNYNHLLRYMKSKDTLTNACRLQGARLNKKKTNKYKVQQIQEQQEQYQ